jgi:hypothetical protein
MFEILSWNENQNENHIITENSNNQNEYTDKNDGKFNNHKKTAKSQNKLDTLQFN